MLPKLIVVALLLAIVIALMAGLVFLVRDRSDSRRTVQALTFRIGLSVVLVAFLFLAMHYGWIHPHGLMDR
jgi:ABC-type Na+ efflux pump permease subunit